MAQTLDTLDSLAPESALPDYQAPQFGRRFFIPGDVVNRATADLPDDQRSLIRWFHSFCWDNNLALEAAGDLISKDGSTVSRIFNGKYGAGLEKICEAISARKKIIEERSKAIDIGFIKTNLYTRIEKAGNLAREFQRIVFLWGDKQIGKTASVKHYEQEYNHGSTRYVRMPAGGARYNFLARLAETLRISPQLKEKVLIERIFNAFDDRMLLIIDEVDQVLLAKGNSGLKTIEFIRELYDERKCGILIIANQEFRKEMESGTHSEWLKRLKRRGLFQMKLPDVPTAGDLRAFAHAFGLDPATGEAEKLQDKIIGDEALGQWLTILKMASKKATKAKRRFKWQDVQDTWLGLKQLEAGI